MQCYTIVSQSDLALTENTTENANTILEHCENKIQANQRFLAFKNKVDAVDMAKKLGKGTTLYILELNVKTKREPNYSTFYLKNKNGNGVTITDFTKISQSLETTPPKKSNPYFSFIKKGLVYASGLATGILYRDQAHSQVQCDIDPQTLSVQQIQDINASHLFNCTIVNDSLLPNLTNHLPSMNLTQLLPENPWFFYGGATVLTLSALAICALTYHSYSKPNKDIAKYTEELTKETRRLEALRIKLQHDPRRRFDELLREFETLKDQAIHRYDNPNPYHQFSPDALFITSLQRRRLKQIHDAAKSNRLTLANEFTQEAKTIREVATLFSRSR